MDIDFDGHVFVFGIVWIDDTNFLVAAMVSPESGLGSEREAETFREHGKIILGVLQNRFKKENVRPLLDYTDSSSSSRATSNRSMWNLWGLLGSGKRYRADEEDGDGGRSNKRRRTGVSM